MYCRKCGSRVRDNLEFCPKCGAKMESAERRRLEEEEQRQQEAERLRAEEDRRREEERRHDQQKPSQEVTTQQAHTDSVVANNDSGGNKGKVGVNKSLVFIIVVIALLVGYTVYNNYQSKDDSGPTSDAPAKSETTSKEDTSEGKSTDGSSGGKTGEDSTTAANTIDGVWWLASKPDNSGQETDFFLVIYEDATVLGFYKFNGNYENVADYDCNAIDSSDITYNKSSDTVNYAVNGEVVTFTRANKEQASIALMVIDAVSKAQSK